MSETKNPWTTLTNEPVYENPWIKVMHRNVITPTGTEGIYGVIHFKNLAVGVVPLDDQNNTWLVGQYRYTLEKYSWELPEGGCPEGEDPLEAAQRELQEETGIRAGEWRPLLEMELSNSVTDEVAIAFVARKLSLGEALPEATEKLKVKKLPFSQVVQMVLDGKITDAFTIAMVLKTEVLLKKGLL